MTMRRIEEEYKYQDKKYLEELIDKFNYRGKIDFFLSPIMFIICFACLYSCGILNEMINTLPPGVLGSWLLIGISATIFRLIIQDSQADDAMSCARELMRYTVDDDNEAERHVENISKFLGKFSRVMPSTQSIWYGDYTQDYHTVLDQLKEFEAYHQRFLVLLHQHNLQRSIVDAKRVYDQIESQVDSQITPIIERIERGDDSREDTIEIVRDFIHKNEELLDRVSKMYDLVAKDVESKKMPTESILYDTDELDAWIELFEGENDNIGINTSEIKTQAERLESRAGC